MHNESTCWGSPPQMFIFWDCISFLYCSEVFCLVSLCYVCSTKVYMCAHTDFYVYNSVKGTLPNYLFFFLHVCVWCGYECSHACWGVCAGARLLHMEAQRWRQLLFSTALCLMGWGCSLTEARAWWSQLVWSVVSPGTPCLCFQALLPLPGLSVGSRDPHSPYACTVSALCSELCPRHGLC